MVSLSWTPILGLCTAGFVNFLVSVYSECIVSEWVNLRLRPWAKTLPWTLPCLCTAGFVNFLVSPLFHTLHSYAPALQPVVDQLDINHSHYANQLDANRSH